jgi:large subunit ribosomal protein L4
VELADAVFGAEVNEALLYERCGTTWPGSARHGEDQDARSAGSGKKLWRQKGTGRARMGSIRSPLWRHGGTVHGPQPRDYSYRLPRKMLLGALRSALTAKLRDGEMKVVQALRLRRPQDQDGAAALEKLERTAPCCWWTTGEPRNLALGARNLKA